MTKKNKPVGGFPSIKKAVTTLLDQGMTREAIMAELGITVKQFRSAYGFNTHIALPDYLTDELRPYAKARNMRLSIFIRYLLQTIIDDKLVNSVLDDNDEDMRLISKGVRNQFILTNYKNGLTKREAAAIFKISPNHVARIYAREKNGQSKTA